MVMNMINETAQKIADAIERTDGATRSSVALKSGIARNTFMRKLNGGPEFGAYEIARIAMTLNRNPEEFLPKEYELAAKALTSKADHAAKAAAA